MKIHWNYIAQGLALGLHFLNYASGVVPAKYQPLVMFGIAVGQAGVSLIAHYYTPSGQRIPA